MSIDEIREQLVEAIGKLGGRKKKKAKGGGLLAKTLRNTAGGAAAGAGIGAGIGYGEKMKALDSLLRRVNSNENDESLLNLPSALSQIGLDVNLGLLREPGDLGKDLLSTGGSAAKHFTNLAKDVSGRNRLSDRIPGQIGKRTAQGAGVGAGAGLGLSLLSALLDRKLGEKIRK